MMFKEQVANRTANGGSLSVEKMPEQFNKRSAL